MRASPARDWHGGSGPGPDSLTSGRTPPQPRRQNNAAARPRPDASGDGYLGTRELSPYRMHCRSSIPRIPSLTPHPGVSEPSPLSDLLNQSDQETRDESDKTLMIGISTGQGSAWIANQLEEAGQIPLKRALVIARTEVNRAYREANLETMRESRAVKGYRRMCYPDTACFACLMLDGEYYDKYEDFSDHPNGKCSAVPVTKHFDPINEPEWERCQEWFERQDEATQRRLMGAGRHDLWKKQGVDPRDMVYIKPNKVWGGSPAVRTLSELMEEYENKSFELFAGKNTILRAPELVPYKYIPQTKEGEAEFSEYNKLLQEKYGITLNGRVTNLDFDSVKASIDGVLKIIDQLPEIREVFAGFEVDPDETKGLMYVKPDGHIVFSRNYYAISTKENLKNTLQFARNTGQVLKTFDETSVGRHEAGHLIIQYLQFHGLFGKDTANNILRAAVKQIPGKYKKNNDLKTQLENAVGIFAAEQKREEIFSDIISYRFDPGRSRSKLSIYTWTTIKEEIERNVH